jgi:hypothetical protein
LNRWNYTQSNPINYTDPSGHSSIPNLGKAALNQTLKRVLPNGTMGLMGNCSDDGYPDWLNYLSGVLGQYIDDISLGAYSKYFLHLDNIDVAVFQEGRNLGHSVALIQAMVEVVVGIAAVEAALLSIPPTVGGGTLCAATTLGACLVIVIPAVSAEVIVLVNGTALTLHGAGVLVRAALDGGGGGGAGSNPSKKLGDNMVKAGRDRPPHSHAHHIVVFYKIKVAHLGKKLLTKSSPPIA